jgi:hypothetical protein
VAVLRGESVTPQQRGQCDGKIKRLEAGRYHFPDAPAGASGLELSPGQFQMILDGIDLSRVRRFKRFSHP